MLLLGYHLVFLEGDLIIVSLQRDNRARKEVKEEISD